MKIKKNKWEDITIRDFKKLERIQNDDSLSQTEKEVSYLSVLCEVDEEDIYNEPVTTVAALINQINFIYDFDFPKDKVFKKYVIDGVTYRVQTDINEFTMSQYIDFQTYWADRDNNIGNLLTTILIPEGKKYGSYDMVGLSSLFEERINIVDYNSLMFFFLQRCLISLEGFLLYLRLLSKMKKTPKKVKELINERLSEITYLIGSV